LPGRAPGEQALARKLYRRLEEDWLLIADRNFCNWDDWCTAADTGAARTLMRAGPGTSGWSRTRCPAVRATGKGELIALITTITDPRHAPTGVLAQAVTEAQIDPDRVKFKRTVRILRRRVADPVFSP
jgi:hypothetical protein